MFRYRTIRIKKNSIASFTATLFYWMMLNAVYYFHISSIWAYQSFTLDLNISKFIQAFLLFVVVFIIMPKTKETVGGITGWLFFLLAYVPVLTLFALTNGSVAYMYGVTGCIMFIFFLFNFFSRISVRFIKRNQAYVLCNIFFFTLALLAIYVVYKTVGFLINLDLSKVYDIRAQFVSYNIPFASHLFNWLAIVFNPIFFVMFAKQKKIAYVLFVALLELVLFSVTGNRLYLFVLPFVVGLIVVVKSKNPLMWVSLCLSGIIMLGMVLYSLSGNLWISSFFTNRTVLLHALISFDYYDFFSTHDITYLSQHSLFKIFARYPYGVQPQYLIGAQYFGDPANSANNGLFGDAFMNFGFLGFLIWGVGFAVFLKLLDSFAKNKDRNLVIAAVGMVTIVLTNVPFLTALFTDGLLVGLILVYLLPSDYEKNLHFNHEPPSR